MIRNAVRTGFGGGCTPGEVRTVRGKGVSPDGNLFNVAITRARSELIVVGDRQAALDSGVSYLASFAEYAHDLAEDRPDVQGCRCG